MRLSWKDPLVEGEEGMVITGIICGWRGRSARRI